MSFVWSSYVTEKLFKMQISHDNSLNVLSLFFYIISVHTVSIFIIILSPFVRQLIWPFYCFFWHLRGFLFYTNAHPVSILYSWIVKGLLFVFSCYHQVSDTVLGNGHQDFVLPQLNSTDTLQL